MLTQAVSEAVRSCQPLGHPTPTQSSRSVLSANESRPAAVSLGPNRHKDRKDLRSSRARASRPWGLDLQQPVGRRWAGRSWESSGYWRPKAPSSPRSSRSPAVGPAGVPGCAWQDRPRWASPRERGRVGLVGRGRRVSLQSLDLHSLQEDAGRRVLAGQIWVPGALCCHPPHVRVPDPENLLGLWAAGRELLPPARSHVGGFAMETQGWLCLLFARFCAFHECPQRRSSCTATDLQAALWPGASRLILGWLLPLTSQRGFRVHRRLGDFQRDHLRPGCMDPRVLVFWGQPTLPCAGPRASGWRGAAPGGLLCLLRRGLPAHLPQTRSGSRVEEGPGRSRKAR
ncbi:cAMP-dependent protein kinase type I-beta regulatory subunit isoform X2 [Camelus ferus]|uniref:cAMP-dependent protein kinase type I-beta regulatory subunit isoform X2 n=1 Tax=Camelus ferus TaxID=419612 RepID=A0A8B8RF55_CAMFR|nr:cAMP-dependent protein kinase type I-beta regulatory subunit isoform X2 [Camelus ferus]